jgi:hypothetical protein
MIKAEGQEMMVLRIGKILLVGIVRDILVKLLKELAKLQPILELLRAQMECNSP